MAHAVWLALGAMVLLGLTDLVYKRGAAAGIAAHHFLIQQGCCFLPAVLLYGLATGTLVPARYMLWGMAAGLFVFAALYNFARALRIGAVSVIAPVYRLSFTVTTALAVLILDEALGPWKLAGLAAAFAAVWLLLGGGAAAPGAAAGRGAISRALVAMGAMGVANFLYKVGAAHGGYPATFVAGQAIVFVPLAALFAWRMDRAWALPRAGWSYGAVTAALFLVALVMLFESLSLGEASVLVPISQMGFVVTAAVGVLLLREPFTARKGAGIACAVAALACLAKS
ncbi:MAG: EamA family transporter [Burkholderiales bacterium]|nr:EamA family transporter [Burkholderiales bacterium]